MRNKTRATDPASSRLTGIVLSRSGGGKANGIVTSRKRLVLLTAVAAAALITTKPSKEPADVYTSLLLRDGGSSSSSLTRLDAPAAALTPTPPLPLDTIFLFRNVCLLEGEPLDRSTIQWMDDNATWTGPTEIPVTIFQGRRWITHTFQVQPASAALPSTANLPWNDQAALLSTHHTPNNNFHLHNDFLFRIWAARNAYSNTSIPTTLLLPQGCKSCWNDRLPLVDYMLESVLQIDKVLYPLEIHRNQCYRHLILENLQVRPYYNHEGRFHEPHWTYERMREYRNRLYRSLPPPAAKTTSHKPTLTWISRGRDKCPRCVLLVCCYSCQKQRDDPVRSSG